MYDLAHDAPPAIREPRPRSTVRRWVTTPEWDALVAASESGDRATVERVLDLAETRIREASEAVGTDMSWSRWLFPTNDVAPVTCPVQRGRDEQASRRRIYEAAVVDGFDGFPQYRRFA